MTRTRTGTCWQWCRCSGGCASSVVSSAFAGDKNQANWSGGANGRHANPGDDEFTLHGVISGCAECSGRQQWQRQAGNVVGSQEHTHTSSSLSSCGCVWFGDEETGQDLMDQDEIVCWCG